MQFIQQQGLKGCKLCGHGILKGGVEGVHLVDYLLEGGVLGFHGEESITNILNLGTKVLVPNIHGCCYGVGVRGSSRRVFAYGVIGSDTNW
ncbi:hypothetical protein TB1_033683 [Malus domestica]